MSRTAGLRGALPPVTPHPFKSLRQYLVGELESPTGPFGYGTSLTYPMALNDQLGDCTIAGKVHLDEIVANLLGQPYTYPGDDAVKAAYFGLTGGPDSGLELSTVIKAWSSPAGLLGTKLAGAATIDVKDEDLMAEALFNFGALYVAVNLPESAENQFNADLPWTLGGNEQPEGGHCVVLNAAQSLTTSGRTVGDFGVVTWGAETACTDNWWRDFAAEAWVLIPESLVQAGRDAVQALDLAEMRSDVAQLSSTT